MKKTVRVLGLVLAAVMLLTVAGCASRGPSVSMAAEATPLDLGGKDSGTTQVLHVGQRVRIILDSNPSTGYRWATDGALPPELSQVGDSVFAPPAPTSSSSQPVVGAGGTETWVFEGKSPGVAALKLKYWRPFEPTASPISTYGVTLKVE